MSSDWFGKREIGKNPEARKDQLERSEKKRSRPVSKILEQGFRVEHIFVIKMATLGFIINKEILLSMFCGPGIEPGTGKAVVSKPEFPDSIEHTVCKRRQTLSDNRLIKNWL